MTASQQPVVGDWYMAPSGETFEVIAYEPGEETVEIQYFDGSLEELELDVWLETNAQPVEPPEDYSGSLDMMREDSTEERAAPRSPNNPLDEFEF